MPEDINKNKIPTLRQGQTTPEKPKTKERLIEDKPTPAIEEQISEDLTLQTQEQLDRKGLVGTNREKQTTELKLREIESVLSDKLEEFYNSLSDADKIRFKTSGEKAAQEILKILKDPITDDKKLFKLMRRLFSWLKKPDPNQVIHKSKSKKIIKILVTWLQTTSNNKNYIEQAAIIKTGELIKLLRSM